MDVVPVDQSHGQSGFENENQIELDISSSQPIPQPPRVLANLPPSFLASSSSIPKVLSINWGNSLEMKALREKILHKAGEHYSQSGNIRNMLLFIEKMMPLTTEKYRMKQDKM